MDPQGTRTNDREAREGPTAYRAAARANTMTVVVARKED